MNAAVAGFVCDALSYAQARAEPLVARLLRAPFSGVDRDEATALIVAAAGREPVVATIAAQRIPLSREGSLAAQRFATALATIADAFRAQGIGAREMLATIAGAFGLVGDPAREATLTLLANISNDIDAAARSTSRDWQPAELIASIDAALERNGASIGGPFAGTPLGPHRREPGAPVVRRRTHQSASSLGAYAECERKWYYRYVCAVVEDRGSSASFYGTAFHTALERFHTEYARGDAAPPALLWTKLDAYVGEAFERIRNRFATQVEFELQRRRARRTARRYLRWFLKRWEQRPFEVIGQETPAELEWDGYKFVGIIDRIDRDDATGNVTVIDYKTGNIALSATEYREKVARYVEFQLPFYYWARTELGDRVQRLTLVPLKDQLLEVQPIELEVVPVSTPRERSGAPVGLIGIDELERARTRMRELAQRLADEVIEHFPATDDPATCTYCTYKNSCRERPRRREDRFGR